MTIDFALEFTVRKKIGGFMETKTVETDPLKRAQELLQKFKAQADAAILSVNSAVGREAHASAVAEAIAVCRRSYGFGHALAQITRNAVYRVSDKPLRELKIQSRSILLPPTPLPDEALEVLEALKATMPAPKIFEGEAEYQRWLKERGLVEADPPNAYQGKRPSAD